MKTQALGRAAVRDLQWVYLTGQPAARPTFGLLGRHEFGGFGVLHLFGAISWAQVLHSGVCGKTLSRSSEIFSPHRAQFP